MNGGAGIAMLVAVATAMIVTGLPTWLLLIGMASVFALAGAYAGLLPLQLLGSVPSRIVGLLENDLLQALPLYVLMGALLNHSRLADILFRAGTRALARSGAAEGLVALLLGAVLAPMNGSVGASAVMLGRSVAPRLLAVSYAPSRTGALVASASTLGVVVPPSLVLILLGDAMLRAHTEAVNATGQAARIVNTQDVFRGALVPAGAVLLLMLAVVWWQNRGHPRAARTDIRGRDLATAGAVIAVIVGLLTAVTLGFVYAVEAAAAGAVALLAYGVARREITASVLREVLHDTIVVSGALFALLVAATMFSLVLRGFETDRLLTRWLTGLGGGMYAPLAVALAALALCALVLDAYEMIFVVVPVLIPPVLVRVPDPVWVAVLVLLVLQASFLIPPFGYSVLMVRNVLGLHGRAANLARSLGPFVLVQALVLVAVLAWPGALWRGPVVEQVPAGAVSDEEARRMMEQQLGAPAPDEPPR